MTIYGTFGMVPRSDGKRITGYKNALYPPTPSRWQVVQGYFAPSQSVENTIAGPVISKFDLLCQIETLWDDSDIVRMKSPLRRTMQSQKFLQATD